MSRLQTEARDLLDLGLLARVLCHEINNLTANQRGFLRLLQQHPDRPQDAQRWLGEIDASNRQLQTLVTQVQHWSRQLAAAPALDAVDAPEAWVQALDWPPPEALDGLADRLAALGCALGGVAVRRVLAIVAAFAGASPAAWSEPRQDSPGDAGVLLGNAQAERTMLVLTLPDHSAGLAWPAWQSAADVILPADDSAAQPWLRALVCGLLRQTESDLGHHPGPPGRFELWLALRPALDPA